MNSYKTIKKNRLFLDIPPTPHPPITALAQTWIVELAVSDLEFVAIIFVVIVCLAIQIRFTNFIFIGKCTNFNENISATFGARLGPQNGFYIWATVARRTTCQPKRATSCSCLFMYVYDVHYKNKLNSLQMRHYCQFAQCFVSLSFSFFVSCYCYFGFCCCCCLPVTIGRFARGSRLLSKSIIKSQIVFIYYIYLYTVHKKKTKKKHFPCASKLAYSSLYTMFHTYEHTYIVVIIGVNNKFKWKEINYSYMYISIQTKESIYVKS